MTDELYKLLTLCKRFHGLDIQFRTNTWTKPWRVRLLSNKNERDDYRLVFSGSSLEEALKLMFSKVEELDGAETTTKK